MDEPDSLPKTILTAAQVTLFALLLYLLTLAPTVLWGDDAELQRLAILREAGSGIRNYWLWTSIAHEFTKLPFGDLAWRVNLACAVFAALTVGVVFVVLRLLECSVIVAWAGSIALAISHTFWLHAVRAEVYSLFLLFVALAVALLLAWHKNPARWPLLSFGLLLIGLASLAHPLVVTLVPAVLVLVICTRKEHAGWVYTVAIVSLMSGLLPYWVTSHSSHPQFRVSDVLAGFLQIRGADIVRWLGFLGYQFMFLIPIGVLGLTQLWKTNLVLFAFFASAFIGNVLFALSFHVPDQYVFYLPSYLIYVLWIGKGLAVLQDRFSCRARQFMIALFTITLLPLPLYRLAPSILNRLNLKPLSVRTLPNRDNNLFFLYPPKCGYYGARLFGETVMKSLPPNAAVLADWLPLQTLTYLQKVEGMRRDVLLADTYVSRGQLAWLLEKSKTRPVFLADNERYYDIKDIVQKFRIASFGPIYLLERKP